MIFKQRRNKVEPKAKGTAKKKGTTYDDYFYLTGSLTQDQLDLMDRLLDKPEDSLTRIKNIITDAAEVFDEPHQPVTLRNAQLRPVVASLVNPRYFLGDSPGLGKTIMSLAMYSGYKLQCAKEGITPKKVVVVTEGSHVYGFAGEWQKYGVKLLPLTNSTTGIKRALKNNNWEDFDGVILNWDGLYTDGFLDFYLRVADAFDYGIFDETAHLLNSKSMVYQATDSIINRYADGLTHAVFLNGTPFEKNIFDFYYQFNILQPKLFPSKKFIEDRYVIRSGKDVYMTAMRNYSNQTQHAIKRKIGAISDYKNQEELKDRLKYYYIGRKKADYSDSLPDNSYILHPVPLSKRLEKLLSTEDQLATSQMNSPRTSDPAIKITTKDYPKFEEVVNFAKLTADDRPLLYVYNKESQKTITEMLRAEGFKVEILNGDSSAIQKEQTQKDFNEKRLDMLVFNLDKAMNLPTSDRIIFYDIPTMAFKTVQVMNRIDRNNYTDNKFYDFFCYLNSPEMLNVVRLAYFREEHSNKFTGQTETVYHDLVEQLNNYFSLDDLDRANDLIAIIARSDTAAKDRSVAQKELNKIIGISK